MKTETYTCLGCGNEAERPISRGQRPKWCPDCRRRGAHIRKCKTCGQTTTIYGWGWHCSTECKPRRRSKAKPVQLAIVLPLDQRSDIRRGYEDGNAMLFLEAVRRDCEVSASGCWVWQRQTKRGYPIVRFGRREHQLHRLVLEVKHRMPLGSQAAHHICANSTCVNPDHLQPVTHRENVAEMLARQSYLDRIAELEEALAEVAPDHPALRVVPVT